MHLHAVGWFAAGLSAGLAAGWLPWARLVRYCGRPALQGVIWPACGALIVMLSDLSLSAWRAHHEPGVAPLADEPAGASAAAASGSETSTGAGISTGAGPTPGASIGDSIGVSIRATGQPAAVNDNAHGAASLDAMLATLERQLRGGSTDPSEWELLAQAYAYFGRADDASNARQRHIVAAAAMLADADYPLPQVLASLQADGANQP